MKGYCKLFFKILRNGYIISSDEMGTLFYIDNKYQINYIQNNVYSQKTTDLVFINEHKFFEVCYNNSIHI